MPDYEMVEDFGIDGGELDGLTLQEAFSLGVEYQMIRHDLDNPKIRSFSRPIHSQNQARVLSMLVARNRDFTIKYMPEDKSENWMWLEVK